MRRGAALAAALLVLVLPGVARAQAIRWTMANEYPATSIQGEADARFAREVLDRTGGRVVITTQLDAASGFRSRDMVDAIARGALTLGNTFMGAVTVDPIFQLPSLPFLASTAEEARALADVARPAYEAALARHNQRLLFLSPWPPAGLWTRTPVAGVEALKGLRVRTADASGVLVFRALGAVPLQVSFADAIPMLRAGQLDAVVSSGDGGAASRFADVLRHFTAIEYATTMSMVTINEDAWRDLDPALQRAVLAAAVATESRQWTLLRGRVADNYARMRAAGVGITADVTPEFRQALRGAAQPAVNDWLQRMGPAGPPILDAYRKRLAGR
jgi:TRAP-type C4-dicarboxylate transport system substrate-binding protein